MEPPLHPFSCGRGSGGGSGTSHQTHPDDFEHSFGLVQNLAVREAEHLDAASAEDVGADRIALLLRLGPMLAAVHLDLAKSRSLGSSD